MYISKQLPYNRDILHEYYIKKLLDISMLIIKLY